MKKLIAIALMVTSLSTFADCIDKNLRNMKGVDWYSQLEYLNRFTKVLEIDSPAPAGFEDYFGAGKDICRDTTATYLRHKSGTMYVMYTTHDDYCDGGNTIGIMINMDTYRNEDINLEKSIVGDIGDSEFYCR